MATRTVTGTILSISGDPLEGKRVVINLLQLGTSTNGPVYVEQASSAIESDANGQWSIDLWVNEESEKESIYEVIFHDHTRAEFIIPAGTGSIDISNLIINYGAGLAPQLPPTTELKADLDAGNLSVSNVDSWRLKLSLDQVDNTPDATKPISAATQAALDGKQNQSAILDATTASYTSLDKSKLDGIESGAQVNDPNSLNAADIGSSVQAHSAILDGTTASFTVAEQNKLTGIDAGASPSRSKHTGTQSADTIVDGISNKAFTSIDKSKLDGIESGAQVNDPNTLTDSDIGVSVQAHSAVLDGTTASFTTAEKDKLAGISEGGGLITAPEAEDLTDGGDTILHYHASDRNRSNHTGTQSADTITDGIANKVFTTADQTKLNGVEDGAQVNDPNTLTDSDIGISVQAHSNVLDGTTASFTAADQAKLSGIESGATADQTDSEIKIAYENNLDTNAFTDSEKSKLAAIQDGATADQTGAEIKVAYEAEPDTNAFTDADRTKLDGISEGATNLSASDVKVLYESNLDTNALSDVNKGRVDQMISSFGGGQIGDNVPSTETGGSVGSGAVSTTGGAVGNNSLASDGFSGGNNARATAAGAVAIGSNSNAAGIDSVQIGNGTNSTDDTIQFRSSGGVSESEFGTLVGSTATYTQEEEDKLSELQSPSTTRVQSTPYNVLPTDKILLVEDAQLQSDVIINLPDASTLVDGWNLVIKKLNNLNNVVIIPEGSSTIDDNSDFTLCDQGASLSISTDRSDWYRMYPNTTSGWALYADSFHNSFNKLSISDTLNTQVTINSSVSAGTDETYLPVGAPSFWDATQNCVTAQREGDSFDVKISFNVTAPTKDDRLDLHVDIGDGVTQDLQLSKTISFTQDGDQFVSEHFSLFATSTFLANGAKLYLRGSLAGFSIWDAKIFIKRDFSPIK